MNELETSIRLLNEHVKVLRCDPDVCVDYVRMYLEPWVNRYWNIWFNARIDCTYLPRSVVENYSTSLRFGFYNLIHVCVVEKFSLSGKEVLDRIIPDDFGKVR